MIVRRDGGRVLVDVEALVTQHRRPASTIRKHCAVVATDPATGRQLYDAEEAAATLATVARRTPHQRPARRSLRSGPI